MAEFVNIVHASAYQRLRSWVRGISKSAPALCKVCQRIDCSWIDHPERRTQYDNFTDLDLLDNHLKRRDECAFCGFVYKAWLKTCGIHHLDLDDLSHTYTCVLILGDGIGFTKPSGEHVESQRLLQLEFKPSDRNDSTETSYVDRTIQVLLPRIADGEPSDKSLNCARTLSPEGIDYDRVKSWIQNCNSWHDECNIEQWVDAPERRVGLRVIDVERRCLTRPAGPLRIYCPKLCLGQCPYL